jgi:hypothetical protein
MVLKRPLWSATWTSTQLSYCFAADAVLQGRSFRTLFGLLLGRPPHPAPLPPRGDVHHIAAAAAAFILLQGWYFRTLFAQLSGRPPYSAPLHPRGGVQHIAAAAAAVAIS